MKDYANCLKISKNNFTKPVSASRFTPFEMLKNVKIKKDLQKCLQSENFVHLCAIKQHTEPKKHNTMSTIQPNTTITAVSICDSNCIFEVYVISRVKNIVTLRIDNEIIRKKVNIDSDGNEYVMALGSYSMAPAFK